MGETNTCASGPRCPGWNGRHAEPTHQPYCPACLDHAARDIRNLVFDWIDLAQLHEPSLSQAPDEHTTGGGHESPTLLADHVEALQAEIVHVASVWEYELRVAHRLADPGTFAPLWRTTVYDGLQLDRKEPATLKARAGSIVQRAAAVIAGRVTHLAALPATLVCPTGVEDEPIEMTGADAIDHLRQLHARSRAMLGRTRRTFWIPGECWVEACGARPQPGVDGPLWRSEPIRAEDPMHVGCAHCGAQRPYPDYEAYMTGLIWPGQPPDANVRGGGMKRYQTRTYQVEEPAGATCDGCGQKGDYLSLVEVVISVHEGEEGGRRDEYDYCDNCLPQRAPALAAAGSLAPLVTGDWTTPGKDDK